MQITIDNSALGLVATAFFLHLGWWLWAFVLGLIVRALGWLRRRAAAPGKP